MDIISSGKDRYGAHFIRAITDIIIIGNSPKISTNFKYLNRVLFIPFKHICELTSKKSPTPKQLCKDNKLGFVGHNLTALKKIDTDIITYFNTYYKYKFLSLIEPKLTKYNIPWKNNDIICVHIRLDDRANNYPDYGELKNKYDTVISHINNDTEIIPSFTSEGTLWVQQHNVNLHKLFNFINRINSDYGYPVHIICSNKGSSIIPDKYNKFIIHNNLDEDHSLWCMINSKILIISSSCFALSAAYLHKGEKVYYPMWNHFACMGLGTKYDRTNWIIYDVYNE